MMLWLLQWQNIKWKLQLEKKYIYSLLNFFLLLLYRLMLTMTNIFRLVSVSVSRFRLNKQTRPWGNWIYLILCQTGTVVYFSVLNKYFIFQFQVLFLGFELQFQWMLLRINRITPNSFCHGDRYKILIGNRVQRKTQD